MNKFLLALSLATVISTGAEAQTIGGNLDIAVTSGAGSAPVQLPASPADFPALLLFPANGTSTDIRWDVTKTSTLSTNTSPPMPPGGICYNPGGQSKFISTWGVTGNATLHVVMAKSCAQAIGFSGGGGGGGGGGGNVTIVGPVDGSGFVEVNCKTGCSGGGGSATWTSLLAYAGPLSVSTTSAPLTFPAGATAGQIIKVYNQGPSQIYYTHGATGTTVATTQMAQLSPYSWDYFTIGIGETTFAAITKSGGQTAIATLELGTGSPNGTGGPINLAVTANGQTSVFSDTIGGLDNSSLGRPLQATAPGTSAANFLLGVQGATGMVPFAISGGSGAFVSGSFLAGALADGAITTIGTEADTAWSGSGSGTEIAILKKISAGVPLTQSGAVLSATNGLFTNILQGNAVLSLTNGLFFNPTTAAVFTVAQPTAASLNATVVQGTAANLKSQVSGVAGAFVSGSFLSGALADGAIATIGTQADTAWVSGSGTEISILKKIAAGSVTFTNATIGLSGGSALVGKFGIDQTTNGVTNAVVNTTAFNVTPTDCSGTATGTSQIIIAASATIHGFTIANIDPTTGSGEPIWITFTAGSAAANTIANFPLAAPTSTSLAGMGSYTTPPGFGLNTNVRGIATSGHKFSCYTW